MAGFLVLQIDWQQLLVTNLVGAALVYGGALLCRRTWLSSPRFGIPQSAFKVPGLRNRTFVSSLLYLLRQLSNHDYWIEQVGFDAYSYLLFIRELLLMLVDFLKWQAAVAAVYLLGRQLL